GEPFKYHALGGKPFRIPSTGKYTIEKVKRLITIASTLTLHETVKKNAKNRLKTGIKTEQADRFLIFLTARNHFCFSGLLSLKGGMLWVDCHAKNPKKIA
ncbi:hypothetical protein L873DRAFT_1822084, partial [Choiromyces venosus 120613-1]